MKQTALAAYFFVFGLFSASSANDVTVTNTIFGDIDNIIPISVDVDPSTGQRVGGPPEPSLSHGAITMYFANDLGATTSIVGDGENDESWWLWDFTDDPNFAAFNASTNPLTSSMITLDVKPTEQFYNGDAVRLPGLQGSFHFPGGTPPGVLPDSVILTANWLDVYSSDGILDYYTRVGTFGRNHELANIFGGLPASYFDDALVRSATISLTRGSVVPEPSTLLLVGLGIAGVLLRRQLA